jgi:hypothetical protein
MHLETPESDMSLAVFDESSSITDQLGEVFRDLAGRIDGLAAQYRNAEPYPHIVIDDFLPADLADELAAEFPGPDSPIWHRFPGDEQRNKRQLSDDGRIPASLRSLIYALNGGQFVSLLEKLTGIGNLVADANLVGGGLHQTTAGGKLDVHIDYSHHPRNRLCRRLNLLLYLTPDWQDEWGGDFELWDPKVTKCIKRVAPAFNRVVVFSTSPTSQHGQPEPLTCPPGVGRKSVALYYYSNGRPEESGEVVEHNTNFRARPGDKFNLGNWARRVASGGMVRDLMPPMFYRWLRSAWNARTRTAGK